MLTCGPSAAEQASAQQCERLGMRWTILRPTLIYGTGLDHNLTPLVRRNVHVWTLSVPVWRWMQHGEMWLLPSAHGPLSRLETDLVADNDEITQILRLKPRTFVLTPDLWDVGTNGSCAP